MRIPLPSRAELFAAVMWCAAAVAATPDLAEGLRLYVPFEAAAVPRYCTGKPDVSIGAAYLGKGRTGGGVNVIGSASVVVSALGNFHRPRGSIAFWHRPNWTPTADTQSHRMILRQSNFQLTWYGPKQIMFFMTGKTQPGKGYRWDYSVATTEPRAWKAGEWRHVAFTWDSASGHKQIYLDGRLAKQGATEWLRPDDCRVHETIALGSESAQGAYDEWAIWDRVLPAEAIAFLAQEPEQAAHALSACRMPESQSKPPVRFDLVVASRPEETIAEPGEPAKVTTVAHNQTGAPMRLELRLSVIDAFGKSHGQWTHPLALDAKAKAALTLTPSARTTGAFKVRADFDWQGQPFRRDLGGFSVWPRARCQPRQDSFFGNHVNSWFGGAFVRQAERLGLSWQRDHNMLQATWMMRAWPDPGEPTWTYSEQVDAYRRAGMSVLGQFFAIPDWAHISPPVQKRAKGSYPRGARPRPEPFERYVLMTTRRYRDYVRVWEVWNEPEVSLFWKGTPEQFGALAERACRVAKLADPSCTVIVGGFTGAWGRDWYERAGSTGAFTHADGISYHGYAPDLAGMRRKHDLFAGLAEQFAPKGKATELWDSEWGVQDTTFYVDADMPGLPARRLLPAASYLEGAARVVRADAMAMGLGVKRSFYYLHNQSQGPGAYQNGSAIETTRAPRPKLMARVALEWFARGAKPAKLVEGRGLAALVLAKDGAESLAVMWLNEDREALLPGPWPADTRVLDLFGNPIPLRAGDGLRLSAIPVYVRAAPTTLEATLRKRIVE